MKKLSLWQAIQMGSEHHSLVQSSKDALARGQQFLARDFRSRADTLCDALTRHGWKMRNEGLIVERIRPAASSRPRRAGGSR